MLNKEIVKNYFDKYKSFGRDISWIDYLNLKELRLVTYYFNLCKEKVFADKYEIYAQNEEKKVSIWTGWDYKEAIRIFRESEEQAIKNKRKEKFKLIQFPYTYTRLRQHENFEIKNEQNKGFSLEIDVPEKDSYEESLNNIIF